LELPDLDDHNPRDLLLLLGEFPANPNGRSFPLFTFLEGLAGELPPGTSEGFRSKMDDLARGYGVKPEAVIRLRNAVTEMRDVGRKPTTEPSVLVVIEPDQNRENPPHYFVRVYDWLPWESHAVAELMGCPGRAVGASDILQSPQSREFLFSDPCKTAMAHEIGRRLGAMSAAAPLVEFLVPRTLTCEDFEAIEIDLLPDMLSLSVALGTQARVVVR
jgi:hypothetical protein